MTHKWKELTENTFRDTLTHIIYRKEKMESKHLITQIQKAK